MCSLKFRRGADKRHHQGRYLKTSLRTKMPMSSSGTTTRRMNSIMSASVMASVAETVSARDAAVAARAKKAPADTGAEVPPRRCESPVCTLHKAARCPLMPRSSYHGPRGPVLGRPAESRGRRRIAAGDEKAPSDAGGEVCVDGVGKNRRVETPRRSIILARRWAPSKEKAPGNAYSTSRTSPSRKLR